MHSRNTPFASCSFPLEKYDEESGVPYYENSTTGEVVWEIPVDESMIHQPSAVGTELEVAAEETNDSAVIGEWAEYWDDDAGTAYYQHKSTGKISYENPFEEAGTDPPMSVPGPVGSGPAAARALRDSQQLVEQSSDNSSISEEPAPPETSPSTGIMSRAMMQDNPQSQLPRSPQYPPSKQRLDLDQPIKEQVLGLGSFDGSSIMGLGSPPSFNRNQFLVGKSNSPSANQAID